MLPIFLAFSFYSRSRNVLTYLMSRGYGEPIQVAQKERKGFSTLSYNCYFCEGGGGLVQRHIFPCEIDPGWKEGRIGL